MTELVEVIPTIKKMKSVLHRKQTNKRPTLPTSLASIVLTTLYKQFVRPIADSSSDLKFFIYQGINNNCLVFCSRIGLEILSKSNSWHADGTFHTASKFYYKFYLIHGWFKFRVIPCVFTLMHKRKTKHYNIVS